MEITINYKNALAGESESVYNPNKGFSPLTAGIEVVRKSFRGLFMAGRSGTQYATNIVDKILATNQFYSIGNAGNIYLTTPGSTPTHALKIRESVKVYDNNSDVLIYGGNLYITSTLNITQCDIPVTTADNDWWTAVAGGDALTNSVPHRIFDFQGVMCITNGNKLCSWDGSTHNDAALTLPAGWVIQDYEIINNRIYLACCNPNNSGGYGVQTRIFIWDGYTTNGTTGVWIDEKPLTLTSLLAIKQLGGILFLFSYTALYYFNGNDAEFIEDIGATVRPQSVCTANGQMFFPGALGIKCYDFKTAGTSTPVRFSGSNVSTLFIGYSDYINCFTTATTSSFYQFKDNNSTDGVLTSDIYPFVTTSLIQKIEICFAENLVTNAAYTFVLYNENAEIKHTQPISFTLDGAIHKRVFNINQKMDAFYFTLSPTNAACKSIRWIKIYYNPVQANTTK